MSFEDRLMLLFGKACLLGVDLISPPKYMGGCQNYGPSLGP